MIKLRIMAIHFQRNPHTNVMSCYSPTNMSDEQDTERFYTDLTYFIRHIPKHNVLIIGGDFNAHLGKYDRYKYSLHRTTNRNGNMLNNFLQENNLLCLNTHYQKRSGQLWTHASPNDFKLQIAFLIINKKWKNNVKNVEHIIHLSAYLHLIIVLFQPKYDFVCKQIQINYVIINLMIGPDLNMILISVVALKPK